MDLFLFLSAVFGLVTNTAGARNLPDKAIAAATARAREHVARLLDWIARSIARPMSTLIWVCSAHLAGILIIASP
jgi:hypothetical protein